MVHRRYRRAPQHRAREGNLLRAAHRRPRSGAAHRLQAHRPLDAPRAGRDRPQERPDRRLGAGVRRRRRAGRGVRRHADRLRPGRGHDGAAGHPAAAARRRARPDLRRVLRPRGRSGHRRHPGRRAGGAARPGDRRHRQDRGAAARPGAGPGRAVPARHPAQVLRRRGRPGHARAAGDAEPHASRPGQEAVRPRGARDRRRQRRDRRRWPARPGTAARSRCGRRSPASTPRAPASARWASGCATSSPNCTARRSTSSTGPTIRRPWSATRCRRRTSSAPQVVDLGDPVGAGRRARLPAVAGDRARRAERPAGGPAHRLADRYPQRRRRRGAELGRAASSRRPSRAREIDDTPDREE